MNKGSGGSAEGGEKDLRGIRLRSHQKHLVLGSLLPTLHWSVPICKLTSPSL